MTQFQFDEASYFGRVSAVDTSTVRIRVDDIDQLRTLQVNRLVAIRSSKPGQNLVGIVQRIVRTGVGSAMIRDELGEEGEEQRTEENSVRVALVGTIIGRTGDERSVFRRTLESVPEIDAKCTKIEGEQLSEFMRVVSRAASSGKESMCLGKYTLDEQADAFIDGNRFFQRHAVIVGSTGSGKSWTTATLLGQASLLKSASGILFDLHGEYSEIVTAGVDHCRVAGSGDLGESGGESILFTPYWMLSYELLSGLLIDRSDQNAPNQAMLIAKIVTELKKEYLEAGGHSDILANFTLDSPVPFRLTDLIERLEQLDTEMVSGARANSEKQGPYFGKLTRLVGRIKGRAADRRVGFMYAAPEHSTKIEWLAEQATKLMAPGSVKIIDCSEVPSDLVPMVIGTICRLVLAVQQWTPKELRHPIALICEEAHLYIPARAQEDESGGAVTSVFGRIAKEGRKYGVGLVIISQRPSEVSRTVLSQCNNFVAMRLTNAEDQAVIRRLLPDSLGGFADLLPILDTGEAVMVGDACLLPSRIRIAEPPMKPASGTIEFWDEWQRVDAKVDIASAVHSLRCQRMIVPE